jgi:ribosomal protein S18 acetylase RimI-like enzyme
VSDIRVRPAALADAPAIAGLHLRSWRDAYRRLAPAEAYEVLTEDVRLARWTATLSEPQAHHSTFVAERDGRLLGVGVAAAPSEAAFGPRGEVRSLYVDPTAKRRGVGRRLLGEVAGEIAAWAYPGVALGVVAGNAPAIAFYESLGARTAGGYVDPGPVWRSENIVLVWEDASALASRCLSRAS